MKGPMTREIKYRCYSKKNGMNYNNTYFILALSAHYNGKGEDIFMQFTGLKDNNGKEIYEGDIVRTNEAEWIAKVVFEQGNFMCCDKINGFSAYCEWEKFEVIGNIYQNPELLEAQ